MPAVTATRYYVQAGWDDVPHLTAQAKAELLASTPPHLRKARSLGEPSMGAGAIYPIDLDEVMVDPFPIPEHWPRAYGMDVGWRKTAAIWGALDRTVDCVYLYAEYYRGEAEPSIHAAAIGARGAWIPGVIDPAADQRQQRDGARLVEDYRAHGLILTKAVNAVEAGLLAVWDRLSTGRLRVFKTLQHYRREYPLYRRDETGKIIKELDHLMDAKRYLIVSGMELAQCRPSRLAGAFGDATAPRDRVAGY